MDTVHPIPPSVAVLVEDLYFGSLIATTARKRGVDVVFQRADAPIPQDASLAVVDLEYPHDWETKVWDYVRAGGKAVAFGPHVDGELRSRARAAGCVRVLAKSRFVRIVGDLLGEVLSVDGSISRAEPRP